mmetsp:Transcript_68561/g.155040  ORF Transcript_68561/g.155040 Transcript_68561/m.155040 type:complete len:240 (+) Transcript_68561:2450-3169(+)
MARGRRQRVQVHESVQHEKRQVPALGAQVDRHLVADGEVELGSQGVQKHVHLVHDQIAPPPQLEDGHEGVRHVRPSDEGVPQPHRLLGLPLRGARREDGLEVPRLLDRVQLLHQLEHERLDGLGRRHHHPALPARRRQLGTQTQGQLRAVVDGSVKLEGVHFLGEERAREALAQDAARHVEKCRGTHLGDEPFAVGEEEREERADHRGLARPHDHLLYPGLPSTEGRHKIADGGDLLVP